MVALASGEHPTARVILPAASGTRQPNQGKSELVETSSLAQPIHRAGASLRSRCWLGFSSVLTRPSESAVRRSADRSRRPERSWVAIPVGAEEDVATSSCF